VMMVAVLTMIGYLIADILYAFVVSIKFAFEPTKQEKV